MKNIILTSSILTTAFLLSAVSPFLPILSAFGIGLVWFLFEKPLWGLKILILLIPIGQFSRIPISQQGAQEIAVMANDLFIPLFLGVWFLRKLAKKEQIIFPRSSWLIIAFGLVALISLIFAGLKFNRSEMLAAALYLVRWAEYAGLFFVSFDLIRNKQVVKEITWFFIGSAFLLAVLGFVQYVVFPDFSFMVAYGWDPHLERLVSTFFDPNFTGMFLVLSLALILGIFYQRQNKQLAFIDKKIKYWAPYEKKQIIHNLLFWMILGTCALILGLALVLTYSRSALLALLIVFLYFGFVRDKKLLFATIFLGFLIMLIFPRFQERLMETFDARTSASKRIESWTNAFTILQNTNPFIGIGYNTYRSTQIQHGFITEEELARSGAGTDSSLLLIFVTTGIFGLLFYLWLLGQGIILGYRAFRLNIGYISAWGLFFASGLIALFAHSQFVNSLLYPFILIFFWIGLGIVTRFSEKY